MSLSYFPTCRCRSASWFGFLSNPQPVLIIKLALSGQSCLDGRDQAKTLQLTVYCVSPLALLTYFLRIGRIEKQVVKFHNIKLSCYRSCSVLQTICCLFCHVNLQSWYICLLHSILPRQTPRESFSKEMKKINPFSRIWGDPTYRSL